MKVGMILLDQNDRYLVDGRLPIRPECDKEMLTKFLKNEKVSSSAFIMLPESIAKNTIIDDNNYVPVTIPELGKADILLVNRAFDIPGFNDKDKHFRLDDFIKVDLEVYIRKEK
ncbi:hypothetical protein ACE65T_001804 [Campylobacter jejuni]